MRTRYRDLFDALLDPDPNRADQAYDAVLFDRADALEDLVELYQTTTDEPRLRFYAVQLMGFSESKAAIPHVVAALADSEASVRAEACRALEDLRARRCVPDLKSCLDDTDVRVRRAAREAIQMLGGRRKSRSR